MNPDRPIRELIDRVRARWRRLLALQGAIRAALGGALVLAIALVLARLTDGAPLLLALLGVAAVVLTGAALVWGVWPAREVPSDMRVARFIEERHPALDDRLVSAVEMLAIEDAAARPALAAPMLADAGRAASTIDPASMISGDLLRRTGFQAVAATVLLVIVVFFGRHSGRRAYDALSLALFPSRITIEVLPANARVARAPRVARIDLEYHYPAALGLAARTEEDSGDIYAPAGTDVRIRVRTDQPAAAGKMMLGDGSVVALTPDAANGAANILTGQLRIAADNSYRIALADREGLTNPGETEYFIRTLEDRPPDVHLRKPARDRSVTRLEEVDIEADAEDDFGIERIDLVYAVRGAAEHVVPLPIAPHAAATSVTGRYTLFLEDLDISPGDFVSYYVRARDIPRGKRSSEGRSDIFFLEVKPFEQEFVMARSQTAGGGSNRSLEELVSAQKEVIVATWKIDRRMQAAGGGAKPEQDIRSVAQAESDLKRRVEDTASSFRESNLRDPRQRSPQSGAAARAPAGEDAMTAAARAMGSAVTSLNVLKTGAAIPPEMEALNNLLRAQADVKRLQVARQQTGSGGGNRSTQDMSSLFDRELQRDQQTNYETASGGGAKNDAASLADKVKELARRQDELNQRQEQTARMNAEERRRELEKLTRDQTGLRERAEELAGQLSQGSQGSRGSQGSKGSQGSRGSSGSQSGAGGQQMRAVSDEMRDAAGDLRRQDPRQAGERGARAVAQLQELERQLRSGGPDDRRRALGEMQLEARQLADAERRIGTELNRLATPGGAAGARGSAGERGGPGSNDALRRLAGEQERLADRARGVEDALDRQAAAVAGTASGDNKDLQRAIGAAARDLNRQRVADRMQQSAEQLRAAAGQAGDPQAREQAAKAADAQQSIARDLDSLADRLADAQAPQNDVARRLAEQRARVQELRDDINRLTGELQKAGQQPEQSAGASNQKSAGDSGRSGQGGSGGSGSSLARLRQEYAQRLQEAQQLLDQLRRDDPSVARGGPGLTFEGQGMTLSAPGTEAFKQDFAKWEQLRQQATLLLGQAESSLSQRLQAQLARDRLAAGAGDRAPAAYQQQVDDYFKALAGQKR